MTLMHTSIHRYVREHPTTDPPDAELVCPRCKAVLPATEFYLRNARKRLAERGSSRGCISHCRVCQSLEGTKNRAERVSLVNSAKAGGCVDCGLVDLDHPEIFDFDHIHPGKVKTITLWLTSGSLDDLRDEMARCEVVCSNCHRIRTKSRPHGKARSDLR